MPDEITVSQLVQLLEDETYNDAAERILGGEDPRDVLASLEKPRYGDAGSASAAAVFAEIVAGRMNVVADAH
jgi:hypothetical protein